MNSKYSCRQFMPVLLSAALSSVLLTACSSDQVVTIKPNEPSSPIPSTPDPLPAPLDCSDMMATQKSGLGTVAATYSDWFEAENAEHNLLVKTEAEEGFAVGSTSGTALRMEKTGELYVRFKGLEINEAGLSEIIIKGASPWGGKFQDIKLYNEQGEVVYEDLDFQFFNSGDNPKKWTEYTINAVLEVGTYELEIGDDWGFVFIDAVKVRQQSVVLDSSLNLTQVNYYKNVNNVLELAIDYNHNKLMEIRVDGQVSEFAMYNSCDKAVLKSASLAGLSAGEHEIRAVFNQGEDALTRLIVSEQLAVPTNKRYEAENQSIGLGVTVVNNDTSASNNSYIENDNFGAVEYVVNAPQAGSYEMNLVYRVGNSDAKRKLYINGERQRSAIGFRYAKDWDTSATWVLPFKQGANTITLAPDFGYLALDYLQLSDSPLQTLAQIQPRENTVYLGDHLRAIRFKVDPVNQVLTAIKDMQGNELVYSITDAMVDFDGESVQMLENGFWVELSAEQLAKQPVGSNDLSFEFNDGTQQHVTLDVVAQTEQRVAPLTITLFDVSHGLAVLMQLPDGRNIMADTGKHDMNEQRVRPFMLANQLPLDEIWTSHRHGDHWGGKGKLLEAYGDIAGAELKDNQSLDIWNDNGCETAGETPFKRGDVLTFGDAKITIQNAHGDQCSGDYLDFNPNSLAFRLDFMGFSFGFQGDIYSQQQDENLAYWGEDAIKVDVLQSNHHWHGSISPEYVQKTNADLIVISASEHVWGAGSFTQDGMQAVNYLQQHNADFRENLFTFDVGHIVIKVWPDGTFSYETIATQSVDCVTDEQIPNTMGYAQSELNQLVVDNFKGYRKETRSFPIRAAFAFQATSAQAQLSGDIQIKDTSVQLKSYHQDPALNPRMIWTFELSEAGSYEIRIAYTSDNDDRAQNIIIDAAEAEKRLFPTAFSSSSSQYDFEAGQHSVEINANWGWMLVHELSIIKLD
jgi:beta-lactamase superfamily II metal-dependent hydrolase